MTDIDLKLPGFLDYFLELMFQHVDLVALPSVGESFEFSTKYTWLCVQSYFIFIKKLSRGLGMRPAACFISKTPL